MKNDYIMLLLKELVIPASGLTAVVLMLSLFIK